MAIRISEEFLERIERNYDEKLRERCGKHEGLGLKLGNSIGNANVYKCNWAICEINEIDALIKQLTILRDAIEEETGLTF